MKFNWSNAYNRLFELLDSQGTYYSGPQFMQVCREFSYDIPDYTQYIDDRRQKGKSTSRKDFYQELLNSFSDVDRYNIYRRFIELFREVDLDNPKVNKLEEYLEGFWNSDVLVPKPIITEDLWNSEKLKTYLNKIDNAIREGNYNYSITLCYTCLEGFFKAFVKTNIPNKAELNELNPLAKEVKKYIVDSLKSKGQNVPEQLINLLTTITNAVSNYRNQHSDSHFDSDADKGLAEYSRDLINTVIRYILRYM